MASPRYWRTWCCAGLLLSYTIQTARYLQVWHSDLTLWAYAVQQAPFKPRPRLNYGRALLLTGNFDDAERAFLIALTLSDQPHVPAWDRRDVREAATTNLEALAVMRALQP